MTRLIRRNILLPALGFALLTSGGLGLSGVASADDTPPASTPGNGTADRHNNPAWAACKKQADDQKLERGEARRDFMKNCLKSAHATAPAALPST
jgi:hypothetical protein